MSEMTGGQALVQSIKREGIETIFALPGVQLDWAFDALYDEQEHIKIYHTRHEQATAYMADGYARTTGKIGTCMVVPGPGLLNATRGALHRLCLLVAGPVHHGADQLQDDRAGRRPTPRDPQSVGDDRLGDEVGRAGGDAAGDPGARARGVPAVAQRPPAPGGDRDSAGYARR